MNRARDRASYDRALIHQIIDAALVAHVGTVRDGAPVVIPMFSARDGDSVLLHGAPASGVIRRARSGGFPVCITYTLVDGLVLARSAFHHSLNYRSAVVIGDAVEVADEAAKAAAFERFVEALAPGRADHLRPHLDKELRGTSVLRVPLDAASAKVRTGPPVDEDQDYLLDLWAGVVPVSTTLGAAVPDPRLGPGVELPSHVAAMQGAVR